MSKLMKTRTIPEHAETYCYGVACDSCKKHGSSNYPNIEAVYNTGEYGPFENIETHISFELNHSYPEGGSIKRKFVHLCPHCFEELIMKPLQEKGIVFSEEEIDT